MPVPAGAARARDDCGCARAAFAIAEMTSRKDLILDQFTKQAAPFRSAPGVRAEAALELVVMMTGAERGDTSLDVACGPGLLACAFPKVVLHATGVDMTPAMLEQAREEARAQGVSNVTWDLTG
jgi:tRNA/tmRNA/rRNA uracil-C5-methylase (TrmA/RlmC/RlmD family)